MTEIIDKTISHYRIHELLGAGGMSVVYKAHDVKLDRFVALKILPPHFAFEQENKARIIREAKAVAKLDHPNICTVYEIGEADGQIFIAMAYYEGETLKESVSSNRLSVDRIVEIVRQITAGLVHAHETGIIHRDVKPSNVIITKQGEVKIIDFGMSKILEQEGLTRDGAIVGTAEYMSPEQAQGLKIDARTDVWSLGVVLYEMLTGKHPFKTEYAQGLLYSILRKKPEKIKKLCREVPDVLDKICAKALAKNTDNRYQSVAEMQADLGRVIQKQLISDTRIYSVNAPQNNSTRHCEERSSPLRASRRLLHFVRNDSGVLPKGTVRDSGLFTIPSKFGRPVLSHIFRARYLIVSVAVFTMLILLAFQKFSPPAKRLSPQESLVSSTLIESKPAGTSLAADREPYFFESFSDSDKSVLFEKGWELIDRDDDLWNRHDKIGHLTLFTAQGDYWVKPHEKPVIKNLLRRKISGDSYRITTLISDFNPLHNYQQAGIFLMSDKQNLIRMTVGFAGPPREQRAQAELSIHFISQENGEVKNNIGYSLSIADEKPVTHIWLEIIRKNNVFEFRCRTNKTRAYTKLGKMEFNISPRYLVLAAFQGISDAMPDGILRQLNWEPVPAHFDFIKVEPIE